MKTRNIIIAMVLMVALLLSGCSQGTGNTASSDKNNAGSSVSDNESKDSNKADTTSQNNNTSSGSRTLVVIEKVQPTPDKYHRQNGKIKAKPLK